MLSTLKKVEMMLLKKKKINKLNNDKITVTNVWLLLFLFGSGVYEGKDAFG